MCSGSTPTVLSSCRQLRAMGAGAHLWPGGRVLPSTACRCGKSVPRWHRVEGGEGIFAFIEDANDSLQMTHRHSGGLEVFCHPYVVSWHTSLRMRPNGHSTHTPFGTLYHVRPVSHPYLISARRPQARGRTLTSS